MRLNKTFECGKIKGEINITSKLEMKLDGMIKAAKKKNFLGNDDELYENLHKLRKLRNTTHMYNPKSQETDWYIFNATQYNLARSTLLQIFKTLLKPNASQKQIINFLTQ